MLEGPLVVDVWWSKRAFVRSSVMGFVWRVGYYNQPGDFPALVGDQWNTLFVSFLVCELVGKINVISYIFIWIAFSSNWVLKKFFNLILKPVTSKEKKSVFL